jgi:hypothetical protein
MTEKSYAKSDSSKVKSTFSDTHRDL